MRLISIDHHPSARQLTVFGAAWLLFFSLFGGLAWLKAGGLPIALALWAVAVVVPLIGWAWPPFLRLAYLAMAYAAFPIGYVVSHLLLAAAYYLVITPIGLIMRGVGYDPMQRNFDPEADTYWAPRDASEDPQRYFRQF